MTGKLAIVTPAKNEAKNIPKLVGSLAGQTKRPDLWIFINDGSTDNTVEVLEEEIKKYSKAFEHTSIQISNYEDEDQSYALGPKYSRIIKFGLTKLLSYEKEFKFEYVGILDSDVFPEKVYYEQLLKKFEYNPKLGIASASKQQEDYGNEIITSYVNKSFAPSGFRVWRRACLDQTDYSISISQDSVSAARAIMLGWKVQSFPELEVSLRQRGAKFGFEYYGKSAYMRHVPYLYVLAGAARMFLLGKKDDARQYINGYKKSAKNNIDRIEDPLAIKYFKNRFFYKLLGK